MLYHIPILPYALKCSPEDPAVLRTFMHFPTKSSSPVDNLFDVIVCIPGIDVTSTALKIY